MADRNPVTGRFLTRPANSGRTKGVKAVKRWFVRPRRRRPPRCGCACHETSACHGGATVRRRLEEAAGVEEATQSTETPLEFLLREMRDHHSARRSVPGSQGDRAILPSAAAGSGSLVS